MEIPYFRFGSGSDSIATAPVRLFLRAKRRSPLECRLSGEERTSIGSPGTSLVSQLRTFDRPSTGSLFLRYAVAPELYVTWQIV